jgi:hypothetical protein
MERRYSWCSERMAKVLTETLVGDRDLFVIGRKGGRVPLYKCFEGMLLSDVEGVYTELYDAPEHERARAMVRRIGLDGAA